MKHRLVLILVVITVALVPTHRPIAQESATAISRTVQRVPAGVIVRQDGSSRWNRLVMIAKPRIASGDTGALPTFIQQTISKFVLTILATVDERQELGSSIAPEASSSGGLPVPQAGSDSRSLTQNRYRLVEVGVGHSVQVSDKLVVILPDDSEKHGVRLSFLERQVLSENQRQFADIRTVVRTSNLLMFDVPSILLRDGEHQEFTMRHLVWVDSKTGVLSTLIWLLQDPQVDAESQNQGAPVAMQVVIAEPIRCWDNSQLEDRAIHVDKREFTLGIPGKRAFALEAMPTARVMQWSEAARRLGGLFSYSKKDLVALLSALSAANEQRIIQHSSGEIP